MYKRVNIHLDKHSVVSCYRYLSLSLLTNHFLSNKNNRRLHQLNQLLAMMKNEHAAIYEALDKDLHKPKTECK